MGVHPAPGGTWTQQAKLVGTGASTPPEQGSSVSLSGDGDTAIVGGPAGSPIQAGGCRPAVINADLELTWAGLANEELLPRSHLRRSSARVSRSPGACALAMAHRAGSMISKKRSVRRIAGRESAMLARNRFSRACLPAVKSSLQARKLKPLMIASPSPSLPARCCRIMPVVRRSA